MKDISAKIDTHRVATAKTWVSMPAEVQTLLREKRLEKGDALEIARVAGIMAAKRTHELIPFCHNVPISQAEVRWDFEAGRVNVTCTVRTNASTGLEMEAMTGASLAALTLYDMLKPHSTELAIGPLVLSHKSGGKSDFHNALNPPAKVALLSLTGSKTQAAQAVAERLRENENVELLEVLELSSDPADFREELIRHIEGGTNIILSVGGTGLGSDDRAVDVVGPLLERELPGVMEAARAYGQRRTPYAMFSRGIAGMVGNTLVITLPGSSRGALESYQALFPAVLHIVAAQRKKAA